MPRVLNYASPIATKRRRDRDFGRAAQILSAISLASFLVIVVCIAISRRQSTGSGEFDMSVILPFLVALIVGLPTGLLAMVVGTIALRRGTYASFVGTAATVGGIIFFLLVGSFSCLFGSLLFK